MPDPALSWLMIEAVALVELLLVLLVALVVVIALSPLQYKAAVRGETLGELRRHAVGSRTLRGTRRGVGRQACFMPFSSKRAVAGTSIGGGVPPACALRLNTNARIVAIAI